MYKLQDLIQSWPHVSKMIGNGRSLMEILIYKLRVSPSKWSPDVPRERERVNCWKVCMDSLLIDHFHRFHRRKLRPWPGNPDVQVGHHLQWIQMVNVVGVNFRSGGIPRGECDVGVGLTRRPQSIHTTQMCR